MAKDRTAKALQKEFGISYMQALSWKRDRYIEIQEVVHTEGLSWPEAAILVFRKHEKEDWEDPP